MSGLQRRFLLISGVLTSLLTLSVTAAVSDIRVEAIDSPATDTSGQVYLTKSPAGQVVMSWLDHSDETSSLRYARFKQQRWQTPQTVVTGKNWFINYADFPSVQPITEGFWVAHWLQKKTGPEASTYAYDVMMVVSVDSGASWSVPFSPHMDNTATEHGFVSIFPWQGKAGTVWLDGRKTANRIHQHTESVEIGELTAAEKTATGMTIRSAVIEQSGTTTQPQLIDGLTCDCCQTDVAVTPSGPVVVYRNRTTDEIRDIYLSRLTGDQWQTPTPVHNDNWQIAGCPVNGPAIAASGQALAVVWFTAADNEGLIKLAFTDTDGSALVSTFDIPIIIDHRNPLGRVDVAWLDEQAVAVSWLCEQQELCLRTVTSDRQRSEVLRISTDGQVGGFPKIMTFGSQLIMAWLESGDTGQMIQTARVSFGNKRQ